MVRITVTGLVEVPGKEDGVLLKLMTPPEALSCLTATGHDLSYKLGDDEGKPQRKPKASKVEEASMRPEAPAAQPEGGEPSDTPPSSDEPSGDGGE